MNCKVFLRAYMVLPKTAFCSQLNPLDRAPSHGFYATKRESIRGFG